MPELPDVEVYKRYLAAHALHRQIARIKASSPRQLAGTSARSLGRVLARKRFESTHRHGKHLFVRLSGGPWLMLHFGMTGSLSYYRNGRGPPRFTRLRIDFPRDAHLAYVDPRRFGRIALADSPSGFVEAHRLGPDALALDVAGLRERVAGKRGAIKALLMDQRAIAGIGNIYADEILFQARIHPLRSAGRLDQRQIGRLFRNLRRVLRKAISARADAARMPRSFLLPRRARSARCPRCNARIRTIAVGGRTTYYCAKCQR